MKITLPDDVKKIIETLEENGYEGYAVGGCVRDSILGRIPNDWDITTSATPQQVKKLFPRTVDTGIQHGTVTVLMGKEGYEVTTYRVDGEYEDARHPKEVTFTANLEEDLPEGAEFLLASQAANAGCVVLSKTQETTEEEQKNAVSHLNRSLNNIGCKRQFDEVFAKDWDKLTDEDFKQLLSCGYHMENYRKPDLTQEKTFQSLYFMNMHLTEKKLQEAAKKLFLDKSCGKIFRIKGFMKNEKEQWIEMNATKKNLVISPIKMGQEVIIVIGEQLDEDAIRSCLEA